MTVRFTKSHLLIGAMFSCSFAYELLIIRSLGDKSLHSLILPSLVVGIYILGLGFGAATSNLFKLYRSVSLFFWTESALALLGGLSTVLVRINYLYFNQTSNWGSTAFPLILTFVIATLSGFELPFFEKSERREQEDSKWHLMIGYSYVGCFAASLIVPFWILPTLGLTMGALLIGALNLIFALLFCRGRGLSRATLAPALTALILLTGLAWAARPLEHFLTKAVYARVWVDNLSLPNLRNIFLLIQGSREITRIESHIQTIDLVPFFPGSEDFSLFLNERPQFHSRTETVYHQSMAHVPHLALNTSPKRVLILGGGDGYLVRELLRLPSVTHIDLVEIDSKMLELARQNPQFRKGNLDALSSPKVFTHVDDAFRWIRSPREPYDAIYMDLPFPNQFDLSRLFSREFYQRALHLLTPNGYVCLDFPVRESNITGFAFTPLDKMRSTLEAVGARNIFSFGWDDGFIVFQKHAGSWDLERIQNSNLLDQKVRERMKNYTHLLLGAESDPALVNSIFRPTLFGQTPRRQ